jgi:hypothetical protein
VLRLINRPELSAKLSLEELSNLFAKLFSLLVKSDANGKALQLAPAPNKYKKMSDDLFSIKQI